MMIIHLQDIIPSYRNTTILKHDSGLDGYYSITVVDRKQTDRADIVTGRRDA